MAAHWLIYALGGGAGHAVRGAQLSAALAQLGVDSTLLCAAHAADWARQIAPRVVGIAQPAPDPQTSSGHAPPRAPAHAQRLALRAAIDRVLRETQADVLLVDTFPSGILGELEPLPDVGQSVFMSRLRRTDAAFYTGCAGYDLVLDLEPNLRWFLGRALGFGPVARSLAAGTAYVDVLFVASEPTQREALARFRDRFSDLRTAWLTPAAGLQANYATRLVIGPCGYNLSYELAAAGIWHVAVPAKRRYDDQGARALRLGLSVFGPQALERRVRALLRAGERPSITTLTHGQLAQELLARCSGSTSARVV